jgi:hypothetical protein
MLKDRSQIQNSDTDPAQKMLQTDITEKILIMNLRYGTVAIKI